MERICTELWKTDGTQQGTIMVKDINFGIAHSLPKLRESVELDGKMYFIATTSTQGRELWVTQGSESTTHIVSDLFVGPSLLGFIQYNAVQLAVLTGILSFSLKRLWKTASGPLNCGKQQVGVGQMWVSYTILKIIFLQSMNMSMNSLR